MLDSSLPPSPIGCVLNYQPSHNENCLSDRLPGIAWRYHTDVMAVLSDMFAAAAFPSLQATHGLVQCALSRFLIRW